MASGCNKIMAGGVALAIALSMSAPVLLSGTAAQATTLQLQKKKFSPKRKSAVEQLESSEPVRLGSFGSFTPASEVLNLRNPVPVTSSSGTTQERGFRFTPSGRTGDRKAFNVAMTTRTTRASEPVSARNPQDGLAPRAVNVDMAVGYKGFAVSGGFTRADLGPLARREGIDLGLSYRTKRWKTSLSVGSEHDVAGTPDPLGLGDRYSVELGGAYALTPRLSLSGGVRYQQLREAGQQNGATGERTEDGAVFLGTALRF